MSKDRVYAVLGSGRQGIAAAYDMLKFGSAHGLIMADSDSDAATAAAARIKMLLPEHAGIVSSRTVDARDNDQLVRFLAPVNTLLSAVPYNMHPQVAAAAIEAGANMCDLGGNTQIGQQVLAQDNAARNAGVTIIPDCGLAPGMVNTLAVYGMECMDSCHSIQLRCGGLPQTPRPPLDYKLVFAITGLTVEYFGTALVIRNGRVHEVDTFTELETLQIAAPVGECEAFVTSGGSSTAPLSFEGKVNSYEYKTIRYSGHHARFKVIKELGLLDTEPVQVGANTVVPRDLFNVVAAPKLDFPEDRDLVAVRATITGEKDGRVITKQYDILDLHDEATGFSAMERTTGFSAAIVAELMAHGKVAVGAHRLELAIPGKPFVEALIARGIPFQETTTIVR